MSLTDYEDFLFAACGLDQDDPIVFWRDLSLDQQRYVSFLSNAKTLHIKAPDTDLTLSIAGRRWVNADGHENFPDGEIFTAPVEDSVNGQIRFSFPAMYQGREVEDVRLVFENGQVVKAHAARGMDVLKAMLQADDGAAFAGQFGFGTNTGVTRLIRNPLFDEKMGGTAHLVMGASLPQTGGKNRSSVRWPMMLDLKQGEVLADGEVIYRDGRFLTPD
jgi:aminopeptidase